MIKEIKFTDKALKQINVLLSKKDKGSFFRIAIKGGGCSGFQYEFTFDKQKNDDDLNSEEFENYELPDDLTTQITLPDSGQETIEGLAKQLTESAENNSSDEIIEESLENITETLEADTPEEDE